MPKKCQKFDSDFLRECLPFWGLEKVQTSSENELFASELSSNSSNSSYSSSGTVQKNSCGYQNSKICPMLRDFYESWA